MRHERWIPAGAVVAFVALRIGGCGFFDTRDPVEGVGGPSFWEPPTRPEIIVKNLEVAFENGIFNDYGRALTPEFTFHPDLADSTEVEEGRPGAFSNWSRDVEVETATAIRASADSLILQLDTPTQEIVGDDDRLLKQHYILTLQTAGGSTIYEGEAWLWTRNIAGEWFIYHWEDISTSLTHRSWGFLKGTERPGV